MAQRQPRLPHRRPRVDIHDLRRAIEDRRGVVELTTRSDGSMGRETIEHPRTGTGGETTAASRVRLRRPRELTALGVAIALLALAAFLFLALHLFA